MNYFYSKQPFREPRARQLRLFPLSDAPLLLHRSSPRPQSPRLKYDQHLQSPAIKRFKGAMHLETLNKTQSRRQQKGELCEYFMEPMRKALNKPYSQGYFDKLFRQQFFEICRMMNTIDQIKMNPRSHYLQLSKAHKYKQSKTLVLDLDQTLVHSYDQEVPSDAFIQVQIQNELHPVWINFRFHAQNFIKNMSADFQIIIFTASHKAYAEAVVNQFLDPQNQYISHVLSRELCSSSSEGFYFKDLEMLDREPKDLIIVDNSCYSFCFDLYNGVPILPFYDNKEDRELISLQEYISKLKDCEDVRKVIRRELPFDDFRGKSAQQVYEQFFKD